MNRDARAIQIKLDELLRAVAGARNEMVDLENLSEEELTKYCREFQKLHLQYAKALEKRGVGALPADADSGQQTSPPAPKPNPGK